MAYSTTGPTDAEHDGVPARLAFEVEDLPGLRNRLLDAACTIEESQPLAGYLRFFVNDPAGNQLEFIEPDVSQASTV